MKTPIFDEQVLEDSYTADGRERVLRRYIKNNAETFNKLIKDDSLVVVFIGANADIGFCHILKSDLNTLMFYIEGFKVPYIVVYKDFSKNKIENNPLILGDRKLVYEKNKNF